MSTNGGARAASLAVALLCAACGFETAAAPSGQNRVRAPDPPAHPDATIDVGRVHDAVRAPTAGSQAPPDVAAPAPNLLDAGAASRPMLDRDADTADASIASSDAAVDVDADAAIAPPPPDASPDPADAAAPIGPKPGAPFSRCTEHTDCDAGLVCTSALSLGTTDGGYCTAFCRSASGVEVECPQPSSGLVRASCRPGTTLCVLGSCERSQCPLEMDCVRTETAIGPGQVVETYTCQP